MKISREKRYRTFEEMYLENYKLVYIFFSEHIEDKSHIEDLCQTLWMKVAKEPEKYLQMDAYWLSNYLRVMAKNISMDFLKKSQKECNRDQEIQYKYIESISDRSFEEMEFFEEERRYVHQAMKILSSEERHLVIMKFYDNRSARQMGEVYNLSEGAVRVKQLRILQKLKKEIIRLMKEDDIDYEK